MKHRLLESTPGSGGGPAAPAAPSAPSTSGPADGTPEFYTSIAEDGEETPVPDPDQSTGAPAEPTAEPPTPADPPVQPQATPPVAPPQPAAPVPTPAQAPTPPVAPSATPPVQPTAVEPPQAPAVPNFAAHRAEFLPKLERLYELTEEEANELRATPHLAMPKLAAKLHYETQLSTYNAITSILPGMMQIFADQQKAQAEAAETFYQRWPQLKGGQFEQTVVESLKAFRAANPKADRATAIERAGLLAMMTLGINPQATPPPPVTPPPAPPTPPRPAGAGSVGHVQPQGAPGSNPQGDIASLVDFIIEEGE